MNLSKRDQEMLDEFAVMFSIGTDGPGPLPPIIEYSKVAPSFVRIPFDAPTVPAPKCCYGGVKEHGVPIERWRRSLLGGAEKVLMCEPCYLETECGLAAAQAHGDLAKLPGLSAWTADAKTGIVPQSFGDERIGGVWAARGMR